MRYFPAAHPVDWRLQPNLTNCRSMIKTPDIKIAGAGPAGLTAAIILAKAGRRVRVFEQRPGSAEDSR
jgi:ribulose 1,5-bisphosphate synthetase/thiazole synthase